MTTDSVSNAIDELLKQTQSPTLSFADYQAWKTYFTALTTTRDNSWQQALYAGFMAPCIGYSFAGGYQAALRSLVKNIPSSKLAALCVTEENGNHPRAIATALKTAGNNIYLSGHKKFITGGAQADVLLVAVQAGSNDKGLPVIKLVTVPADTPGLIITPMPELPFVPEIDHAAVSFNGVSLAAGNILPGDGYSDYVKPFRTIEDIHVALSISAYALKTSLQVAAPHWLTETFISITASHCQLCQQPAQSTATHLTLNGSRELLMNALQELEPYWQAGAPDTFQDWLRDKAILKVAATARDKRTEKAWQQYDK